MRDVPPRIVALAKRINKAEVLQSNQPLASKVSYSPQKRKRRETTSKFPELESLKA